MNFWKFMKLKISEKLFWKFVNFFTLWLINFTILQHFGTFSFSLNMMRLKGMNCRLKCVMLWWNLHLVCNNFVKEWCHPKCKKKLHFFNFLWLFWVFHWPKGLKQYFWHFKRIVQTWDTVLPFCRSEWPVSLY